MYFFGISEVAINGDLYRVFMVTVAMNGDPTAQGARLETALLFQLRRCDIRWNRADVWLLAAHALELIAAACQRLVIL